MCLKALGHDFENHTLTTEPDEDGLYAYVCDREGCDEHSDERIVKGDSNGNIFELTATTDGETGTTTYSAASVTIEDGTFVKVGTDVTLPAYRAVLWVNGVSGASAAPARLSVDLGNGETSLGHLGIDAEPLGFCYDLNGNMVSEPRHGEVFIMNGRKYIIK